MLFDNLSGSPRLEARLRREIQGEVLFDRFSRGRYATDASIYQIEPLGVVVPKSRDDAVAAIAIARGGVPMLPRGGGTSQCGQTVARALVIDCNAEALLKIISIPTSRTINSVDGQRKATRLNPPPRRTTPPWRLHERPFRFGRAVPTRPRRNWRRTPRLTFQPMPGLGCSSVGSRQIR